MIFSLNWLREWVDVPMDVDELVASLTMAGLEVDGTDPVARNFAGVVVGKVEDVAPHPDADKLRLCRVNDGESVHQVVCGAPNVAAGMQVPFARLGASIELPGQDKPLKIKAAKLRGIESQGMLCSAEELGLEEKSEGLLPLPADAPTGQNVRDYLGLDDLSIELDLTPNRGDCLGMMGLARELGVLTRGDVCVPAIADIDEAIDESFPVSISAPEACPRYLGRVIRNINPTATTPLWMQEKLRRSGLRSIDPVVDVTNFVLMELGQPMHAFDLERLSGGIEVRYARADEEITLLDGKAVALNDRTLVIADADKAVAMAGVMGGLDSSVTEQTAHVFLECAFFAPLAIAGKARDYGMHTDASHRYERGVDFELQHRAIQRATELLLEIVGGEAGPVTEARGQLPEPESVTMKYASVPRLLGIEMPADEIKDILIRLGFDIVAEDAGEITVKVPSFRFDVSLEADLIEELARIYGYNRIPKSSGMVPQRLGRLSEADVQLSELRGALVGEGYQEIISYSFVDPALLEKLYGVPEQETWVGLSNPISSDMSIMRPSLLPGLIGALLHNTHRQQARVRLFETGQVFSKTEQGYLQEEQVAGLIWGDAMPAGWSGPSKAADFYDAKGMAEVLLSLGGLATEYRFVPEPLPGLHRGRCAQIVDSSGHSVGYVAALDPAVVRALGLGASPYVFELSLRSLRRGRLRQASSPSRYPAVSRDLAMVVEETLPAEAVLQTLRENAGEFLIDLRIFDVYQGDAIEKGKKSVALGLTWQHPSRTLSDEEINAIISNCIKALQEQFNANLRN